MSEYKLPEGMDGDGLRLMADVIGSSHLAEQLGAWADAIDPPEPESVVTDEMVVKLQRSLGVTSDVPLSAYRTWLKAVERLGWLRDPDEHKRMLDWIEQAVLALDAASRIGARSCSPGDGLDLGNHSRLVREASDWTLPHDLESAADNPSPTGEPWPTDELVEAAALAMFDHASPKMTWSESIHQEVWRERAAAALEAVAPPGHDGPYLVEIANLTERLNMAEGLLRRVLTNFPESVAWSGRAEAEYLRSLSSQDSDMRSLNREDEA